MSGFYGDLSVAQTEALNAMKATVESDDHTLLRFLRARQFSVDKALEMYNKYVQYRKTSGIEQILTTQIPKTELFKRLVPHSFHGFDLDGRPVYIEKTGSIDYPTVYKHFTNEELMTHHCWQMEHQIERCKEGSKMVGHVVDSVCNLIDLQGLNMSHRKAVTLIKLFAGHDQAYHPERMGRTIVVNAPWIFPFFWKLCSVFLDENTKKKIIVLGKDYKKRLTKFIPIENLPEEYGGKCKCDGKQCVPVADISDLKKEVDPAEILNGLEPVITHKLASKDKVEIKLECGDEGGVFEWAWRSTAKDIQFSAHASFSDSKDAKSDDVSPHGEPYPVVEPERLTHHKGAFTAESKCTVILSFDNGFSRFTSKTFQYHAQVIPLTEASVLSRQHSKLDLEEKSAPRTPSKLEIDDKELHPASVDDHVQVTYVDSTGVPVMHPSPSS